MARKLLLAIGILAISLAGFGAATTDVLATDDKVKICHAAGLDGTTKYVTLEISRNAVYGPGGHFNENGTPQAGHEDDYLGECKPGETTETETTTTTETEPPPPPCPGRPGGLPPDPPGGKDGKPGNDECVEDPPEETPTTPSTPPAGPPTTPPPAPEPAPTPTPEPPPSTSPEPSPGPEPAPATPREARPVPKPESPARAAEPTSSPDAGTLPYTGLPLALVALLGAALAGIGWRLRR